MTELEIQNEVHNHYWINDFNCATTTLKILSKAFNINLCSQVIDSAVGMHGAGKFGAQCGLVEGSLLFIGIYGRYEKINDNHIVEICSSFAKGFEEKFSSLLCNQLRPGGFKDSDQKHLCENLTVKAIIWTMNHLNAIIPKFNSL